MYTGIVSHAYLGKKEKHAPEQRLESVKKYISLGLTNSREHGIFILLLDCLKKEAMHRLVLKEAICKQTSYDQMAKFLITDCERSLSILSRCLKERELLIKFLDDKHIPAVVIEEFSESSNLSIKNVASEYMASAVVCLRALRMMSSHPTQIEKALENAQSSLKRLDSDKAELGEPILTAEDTQYMQAIASHDLYTRVVQLQLAVSKLSATEEPNTALRAKL